MDRRRTGPLGVEDLEMLYKVHLARTVDVAYVVEADSREECNKMTRILEESRGCASRIAEETAHDGGDVRCRHVEGLWRAEDVTLTAVEVASYYDEVMSSGGYDAAEWSEAEREALDIELEIERRGSRDGLVAHLGKLTADEDRIYVTSMGKDWSDAECGYVITDDYDEVHRHVESIHEAAIAIAQIVTASFERQGRRGATRAL